jgi:Zn ribbon nucleic-acid-binding protein
VAIACPICNAASVVKHSRQRDGTLRRQRECYKCGHRWFTVEMPEADFKSLRDSRARHSAAGQKSGVARRGFDVPPERLDEYRHLTRTKHMRAADAARKMGLIE